MGISSTVLKNKFYISLTNSNLSASYIGLTQHIRIERKNGSWRLCDQLITKKCDQWYHDDFMIILITKFVIKRKIKTKSKNFCDQYSFIFTTLSFFINSPHNGQGVGSENLHKDFFTANFVSSLTTCLANAADLKICRFFYRVKF
ncbi:hypothetical protein BpHYR1_044589 [Brachionus plicatilis]|uniref:Uncharacterized protein n=1 Tax=Brachionus plicatilis TaxID=10195 RepID=A0A3M7PZ49_BRAPC|nr:hypothetical protein BpHYR1_044589 [Brachionus plicatilis]